MRSGDQRSLVFLVGLLLVLSVLTAVAQSAPSEDSLAYLPAVTKPLPPYPVWIREYGGDGIDTTSEASGLQAAGQRRGAPARQQEHVNAVDPPAAEDQKTLQQWSREVVDMPGYFHHMSDHSLAYDSEGRLHLAYGGDRLRYATFDGESWQVAIIDEEVGSGMGAALALDAAGRPHISYIDVINFKLKYAYWNGESWRLQVLGDAHGYTERTAIDIDTAGRPHIVYKTDTRIPPSYTGRYAGYARWTGSQWELETLAFGGQYLSFALDSAGAPHISYFNNYEFRHATKQGGAWHVEPVGLSSLGYGSSIAVDSQDRPHVAYIQDEQNAQLIYAYLDGSEWISSTIASAWPGLSVSLTLDEADTAHIALGGQYFAIGNGQAMVKSAAGAMYSTYSAIALDGEGRPAISYLGQGNMICKRWDGDQWVSDLVDDGGRSGLNSSIDVAGYGDARISYYTASGMDGAAIRYAQRDDMSWAAETITKTYMPQYPHSAYDTSLALDSRKRPHVAFWYSDYYSDGLYYGYKAGESWQIEQIADDASSPNDLVLDSSDRPHIAFTDSAILWYGRREADGWQLTGLTDGFENLTTFSLALDEVDRPHFAYVTVDGEAKHLKLAAWSGADWQFSNVESIGLEQEFVSAKLALGGDGRPHIAYVVDTGTDNISEVRYATQNGESWTVEVVDNRRWWKGIPEIVLDRQGDPAIVFSDPALPNRGIQVATQVEGQWQVETAAASNVGSFCASGDGRNVYVAYHDELGEGLMFAGPPRLSKQAYLPAVMR